MYTDYLIWFFAGHHMYKRLWIKLAEKELSKAE